MSQETNKIGTIISSQYAIPPSPAKMQTAEEVSGISLEDHEVEDMVRIMRMEKYKQLMDNRAPDELIYFEDVHLTDDEMHEVLHRAKIKKLARMRELEYWEEVWQGGEEKVYQAEDYWSRIQKLGKRILGEKFVIDDDNKAIIRTLCYYFANDPDFEQQGERYALDKGLYMYGPVGCGKSTLMTFFQVNQRRYYRIASCTEIADDYAEIGPKVLKEFTGFSKAPLISWSLFRQNDGGYYFDDLGRESLALNYGNSKNVMQSIIDARYRNIYIASIDTHYSSNVGMRDLKKMYGEYIFSRLMGSVNVIEFSSTCKDRRLDK